MSGYTRNIQLNDLVGFYIDTDYVRGIVKNIEEREIPMCHGRKVFIEKCNVADVLTYMGMVNNIPVSNITIHE